MGVDIKIPKKREYYNLVVPTAVNFEDNFNNNKHNNNNDDDYDDDDDKQICK